MNKRELAGEICACVCMLAFLFMLLVFGTAMMPQQHGMHSESVYREHK